MGGIRGGNYFCRLNSMGGWESSKGKVFGGIFGIGRGSYRCVVRLFLGLQVIRGLLCWATFARRVIICFGTYLSDVSSRLGLLRVNRPLYVCMINQDYFQLDIVGKNASVWPTIG